MDFIKRQLKNSATLAIAAAFFLTGSIALAAWQGTTWILTGESINSVKLKANFDYLYSLWKRTANDLFYTEGNVGIGTTTPAVTLDIAGSLRIGKDNIICGPDTKGVLSYDTTTSSLEICDGTTWTSVVDPNSLNISAGWVASDLQVYSKVPNGSTWEVVDLSPTIGAVSTLVSLEVCSAGTGNPWVAFRPSGETSEWRQWNAFSASANSATPGNGFCGEVVLPTGSNGAVELLGENTDTVTVTLKGFIGEAATVASTTMANGWIISGDDIYSALPGNVGVGVQTPNSKLHVAGDIIASSTKLTGAVWSPSYCDQNGLNCKTILELGSATSTGSTLWLQNGSDIYYSLGNVGIGTSSPLASLHVDSSLNDKIRLSGTQSAPHTIFLEGAQGVRFWDDDNGELMRITETGNVGIGTSNPQAKLSVGGTMQVDGGPFDFWFDNTTDTASGVDTTWRMIRNDGTGNFHIYINSNGGTAPTRQSEGYAYHETFSPGSGIYYIKMAGLGAAGSSITWNDAIAIDATNNSYVGIGITNPSSRLEVAGNVEADSYCDRNGANCSTPLEIYNTVNGITGDNLGNHIATQNLQMSGFWINGDGGDGGIKMSTGGQIISDAESTIYDVWIQGGASTAASASRNLAILGFDNDSGDYLYLNYAGEYTGGIRTGSSLGINVLPGVNTFNNGKAIALGDNDTGIRQNGDGVFEVWTNNVARSQIFAENALFRAQQLAVGWNRTGNRYAYLDLIGDDTYTNYGLRLLRGNTGANTWSGLYHRGTGTLYLVAVDAADVRIRTNNTDRLTVQKNTGNIGIGTTNPGVKLHVLGGSDVSLSGGGFIVAGSITGTNIGIDDNEIEARNNGAKSPLYLQNDGGDLVVGASKFVVKDSGNVGVGTTAPAAKLHVAGLTRTIGLYFTDAVAAHINTDGALYRYGGQAYLTVDDNFYLRDTNGDLSFRFITGDAPDIRMGTNTTSGWNSIWMYSTPATKTLRIHGMGDSSNQLRFGRYGNNYGSWEANPVVFDMDAAHGTLFVAGTSRVGIGDTNPTTKLEVAGDVGAVSYCDRNGANCSTPLEIYNTVNGITGDNLGNHIATQNLQMSGFWINGDGGNGGIWLNNTGGVRIDSESSVYDLWIQGGAATSGADRNLAFLGYDNNSGDYLYINYAGEYTRGVRIGSSLGINVLPTTGTFNNGKAIALGDNDTGIRQDGDGVLEFWTNNVERMHITSTGNIGIGTASPAYKLDVVGTVSFDSINVGRGTVYVENNANDNADGAGVTLRTSLNPSNLGGAIFAVRSSGQAARLWVGQAITSSGSNHLYVGTDIDGKSNPSIQLLNTGNAYFNGNVGVGTTSPAQKLHVANGLIRIENNGIYTDIGPTNSSWSHFYTTAPAYFFDTEIRVDTGFIGSYNEDLNLRTSGITRMTISNTTGNVGIGTTAPTEMLEVAGNVKAVAFLYSSDKSLKKDIYTLNGLDIISKLRGVSFVWKENGEKSMGLIAQEVEKVAPELVHEDPNTGLKSVLYGNLVAPLIEAVKELYTMILDVKETLAKLLESDAKQNAEIEALKARLEAQERELRLLKAKLEN